MGHMDLMRQRIYVEPTKGTGALIPGLERIGQDPQAEALRMVGKPPNLPHAEPLLDRLHPP